MPCSPTPVTASDELRSRMQAQIAASRNRPGGRHAAPPDPVMIDVQPLVSLPPPRRAVELDLDRPQVSGPTTRRRRGRPRIPPAALGLLRLIVLIVVATTVAVSLRTYIVQPFWIPSQSMEPTLHGCPGCNDDRLLVDKLSYRLHDVHRGDVVVFSRPPGAPTADADLIKRVIALPGETVSARGGRIYIGNRPLIEPYINPVCNGTASFSPIRIPVNEVFVMGDNRCDSTDSRVFGPIDTSSIIGRAFITVWPLERIHWL